MGSDGAPHPPLPPLHLSPAAAELAAAEAALASSWAALASLRTQIELEEAAAVREARSGRKEGEIPPSMATSAPPSSG